jgi:hypothetical protein
MLASSLRHPIATPTGPRLSPTDEGRSLLLGTRSWSDPHGLLWRHPHPLTDQRRAGEKTEGLEGIGGNGTTPPVCSANNAARLLS